LYALSDIQDLSETCGCASRTSDGAEGVEVFSGQQRRREFTDQLLEQSGGVVRTDLVPAERTAVKRDLQLLLQHLGPNTAAVSRNTLAQRVFIRDA